MTSPHARTEPLLKINKLAERPPTASRLLNHSITPTVSADLTGSVDLASKQPAFKTGALRVKRVS